MPYHRPIASKLAIPSLLLVTVLVPMTGCLPLAGWSAKGYTVDDTKRSNEASVAGHCFRLRYDADVRSCQIHIELHDGGSVEVKGSIHVITPGTSPPGGFNLPKGSQIVVERVLRWENVETASITPYVRIDGDLIDASELFEYKGSPAHLIYTPRLLEPCAASGNRL